MFIRQRATMQLIQEVTDKDNYVSAGGPINLAFNLLSDYSSMANASWKYLQEHRQRHTV